MPTEINAGKFNSRHKQKDKNGNTSTKDNATFGELGKNENGDSIYFFQVAKTYDYVDDYGYSNLGDWIEKAAKDVDRKYT